GNPGYQHQCIIVHYCCGYPNISPGRSDRLMLHGFEFTPAAPTDQIVIATFSRETGTWAISAGRLAPGPDHATREFLPEATVSFDASRFGTSDPELQNLCAALSRIRPGQRIRVVVE